MNTQEFKTRYAMDSEFTKAVNAGMHRAKAKGFKPNKDKKAAFALNTYIKQANNKLGRGVEIETTSGIMDNVPTFGINWSALGTRTIPETKQFIAKLQMAIDLIQNAPKAPAGSEY